MDLITLLSNIDSYFMKFKLDWFVVNQNDINKFESGLKTVTFVISQIKLNQEAKLFYLPEKNRHLERIPAKYSKLFLSIDFLIRLFNWDRDKLISGFFEQNFKGKYKRPKIIFDVFLWKISRMKIHIIIVLLESGKQYNSISS